MEELENRNFTRLINYNEGFASEEYLSDPEVSLKS